MSVYDNIRALFQGDLTRNIYEIVGLLAGEAENATTQPLSRSVSGATTFLVTDLGAVVHAIDNGAQAFALPNLSSAVITGRELILSVQCEGAASVVTITPVAGVQIDNAGSGVAFVGLTGRVRIQLVSTDGIHWFSGTP